MQTFPEFLSGYFGLARVSLFREFPGASDYDTASLVSYDFSSEDWCVSAAQAGAAGGVQYSPPYFDDYVKQNMITLSLALYHPETGQYIGCAGADLSLRVIQRDVSSLTYTSAGRSILFHVNTTLVIGDSAVKTTSALHTYKDLTNPTISDATWAALTSSQQQTQGQGQGAFVELPDYYLQSQIVGSGDYVFVSIVPKDALFSRLDDTINKLQNLRTTFGIVVAVVSATFLLIVIPLESLLVDSLVSVSIPFLACVSACVLCLGQAIPTTHPPVRGRCAKLRCCSQPFRRCCQARPRTRTKTRRKPGGRAEATTASWWWSEQRQRG